MKNNSTILEQNKTTTNFFNLPTSPAVYAIMKVLASGGKGRISDLPKRDMDNKIKISFETDGIMDNKIIIESCNAKTEISLEMLNMKRISKPAKKFFLFFLIKINEQAYSKKTLRRNYIKFSLQDIVESGLYTTTTSAKIGFDSCIKVLMGLQIKCTVKRKNKEITTPQCTLFKNLMIEKGNYTIYINEQMDWKLITSYYTILPLYIFQLKDNAFNLLYYIFYLARQKNNLEHIKKDGYFTISLKFVYEQLQLPDIKNNKDPKKTIKDPIEKAINEIMKAENSINLNLQLEVDRNARITTYLNEGHIKVILQKDYYEKFASLAEKNKKALSKKDSSN